MKGEYIAIIVLACAAVLFAVLTGALYAKVRRAVKKAEQRDERTAADVKVRDGVRYSTDDAISDNDGIVVSLQKGDVVLERGQEYTVGKGGRPMPGAYTALSAAENRQTFKLRVAGFVREYKHGDTVVLAEGDVVTAVSDNVILR